MIIAQGAEALIKKSGSNIIKDRIKKSYRLPILDERLRKQRTKKESKLLEKAISAGIKVPRVINQSQYSLVLEHIYGKKLASSLDNLKNKDPIAAQIGSTIARLHDLNIIHGDLTTSNMILSKNDVYFIDFGLGSESARIEDKATDLHVLKEALEARHFKHASKLWESVLKGYQISKNARQVLKQLEKVEKRGRYKNSY
ncbi:MAG TPA: KEOPS complex kinase/ATPase Bud32 [Candidatus Nanoarchaeia archaeon]|nr:KEOPS complex kinase/ATPase Bud32 [Candidatus Nanoarchaeia archaeon]